MQFCSECNNMYYMRLSSENGVSSASDKLEFYCRNCGHEDSTLTNENIICVSEYQTQSSDMKLKNMINKYTKYDPTLPRAHNILCPNPQCTNHTSSVDATQSSLNTTVSTPITRTIKGQKKATSAIGGATANSANTINDEQLPTSIKTINTSVQENSIILKSRDSDIIYIRYDDENMKYAWICSKCDYTWTNDNHIDNKN